MESVAVYLTYKKKQNKDNRFKNIQKNIINEYCINKNYDYDLFVDIVENNVDLFHRNDFNRLKKHIKNKDYNKVIVKNIGNLSRDVAFCLDFINFLKDNSCLIECIDDSEINYKILNKINNIRKNLV